MKRGKTAEAKISFPTLEDEQENILINFSIIIALQETANSEFVVCVGNVDAGHPYSSNMQKYEYTRR